MSHRHDDETANPELTPDLRPVEHALDDLATRERSAAPPSLEERLFASTRGALAHSDRPDRPAVIARIGPVVIGPMRLAAAFALAAVGVFAALSLLRAPATTTEYEEVVFTSPGDVTLDLGETNGDDFDDALAAVESNLDDFWSANDEYDWLIEAAMETGSL